MSASTGKFSTKTGDSAFPHLVLTGANGEPIVWSEVYASGDEGVRNALEVNVRTVMVAYWRIFLGQDAGDEAGDMAEVTADSETGQQIIQRITDNLLAGE